MTDGQHDDCAESGEDFIQRFHTRHAGRTIESFGGGRINGGDESSYARLAATARDLPAGAHLLDLACGDGVLLAEVARRRSDLRLSGVDLNEAEVEMGRSRAIRGARFLCADARQLPFADGAIDHVICHMSFMLFDEPEAVVAELARVMRPGAAVALIVSDRSSPAGARRVFVDLVRRYGVEMPRIGTRRARSPEGLRDLFECSKFAELRGTERLELVLDGPVDKVWTGLSLMYNFEPLSLAQKAEVESDFRCRFVGEDVLEYRMSLLHAEFRRVE